MSFFEYHRRCVTERAVALLRVVKGLDVIEDGKLGVVAPDWDRLIQPVSDFSELQNDSMAALS